MGSAKKKKISESTVDFRLLIASDSHVCIYTSVYCSPDWPYLSFSPALHSHNNLSPIQIDMLTNLEANTAFCIGNLFLTTATLYI